MVKEPKWTQNEHIKIISPPPHTHTHTHKTHRQIPDCQKFCRNLSEFVAGSRGWGGPFIKPDFGTANVPSTSSSHH